MSYPKKTEIFLVEDDQSFGSVLKSYLEINDYRVTWVDDGKYAAARFRNGGFDLCILDVMLPNLDGFMIASLIKKINAEIPFIFLTARTLREDILKGYNLGADDYITKPFDTEVLLCKIKAILKRSGSQELKVAGDYEIGSYRFDYPLRQISGLGNVRMLSPKEAELLRLLCENRNKLLPRDLALTRIWGDDGYFTARSMDVFITHLRKYLAGDPRIEIKNLHGSGFILTTPG
jgi:two-component system, OmpR family, response regulator